MERRGAGGPSGGALFAACYTPAPMAAHLPIQLAILKETSPKKALFVILGVSVAALALLVGVIYGHGRATEIPSWVAALPALNAFLNATSALFLVLAYRAIRRRDVVAHSQRMLVSLGASALFLVSYIVYHSVHGDTRFAGEGLIRPFYFFILISHIALSAVALPLVFLSFFLSLSGRFPRHKAISRYTLPDLAPRLGHRRPRLRSAPRVRLTGPTRRSGRRAGEHKPAPDLTARGTDLLPSSATGSCSSLPIVAAVAATTPSAPPTVMPTDPTTGNPIVPLDNTGQPIRSGR